MCFKGVYNEEVSFTYISCSAVFWTPAPCSDRDALNGSVVSRSAKCAHFRRGALLRQEGTARIRPMRTGSKGGGGLKIEPSLQLRVSYNFFRSAFKLSYTAGSGRSGPVPGVRQSVQVRLGRRAPSHWPAAVVGPGDVVPGVPHRSSRYWQILHNNAAPGRPRDGVSLLMAALGGVREILLRYVATPASRAPGR